MNHTKPESENLPDGPDGTSRAKNWLLANISLHAHDNRKEELASAIAHGAGVLLSIAALILLTLKAAEAGNGYRIFGAVVYGFTMILLYSSSTLYHFTQGPILKRVCRILDHGSIYFLIAGTYTPVMIEVGGTAGWTVFAVVWALTVAGIFFTLFFWGRYGFLHVLFYLAMGWIVVFVWRPVAATVGRDLIKWGIAGGLSYTIGTIVYAMKKVPYYHAVWHLFVLGGSICFFLGIYLHLY